MPLYLPCMKPYQQLSLLALTAILMNPILNNAQAYPAATPRVLYLAKKVSAQDLVNRGIMKAQSGDNQGAIADLNEAIEMDKNLAVAYHYRGIVRVAMGDKPSAMVDFKQAADLFQKQGKMDDYQVSMSAMSYIQR
jgi:Flp pilus assembly protein TadD